MPTLADTLGSIPGYSGYQASRLRNQQQEQAELQQYGSLQSILAKQQAQQEEGQIRDAMTKAAGDPMKAIPALMSTGTPRAIELAAKLKGMVPKPDAQPIGSGGLRLPDGTIVPPAARPEAAPKPAPVSPLARLHAEKAALPAGDPRHKDYADAIRKETLGVSGAAAPTTGDFGKTGDDFLNTLPESDRALIKKIASYDIDPKTLSTRGGQRERILSMAAQYSPGFDQKNYNMIATGMNRFATGPQGNTVRSLNVAVEHMDTARKLGDALQNSDIPLINRLANEIATQTGKPAPTSFNAVKEIVADEVVKGVIGNAGALSDREAAAKKIRDTSSPAQLKGVLDSWTELMGGQLKGLEKQYEGATLGKKDFRDRYLTKRARDALEGGGSAYVEQRRAKDGRLLGKKADGTIEVIKE